MAGEPAIVKVLNALIAAFETIPGIKVFEGRPEDEPIMPGERPCIVVRFVEGKPDGELGGGQYSHELAIDLDLYGESMTLDTITRQLADMLSGVAAALDADRSLGGLVGDIEIMSYTADAQSVADLGCLNVGLFTRVITPSGDFNTVMGVSGPIP
jgi:hypothetical protein